MSKEFYSLEGELGDQDGFACGTVCIVDDEPANLILLGNILSNHGYKIMPAVDGEVALNTIKDEHPDIILLDIVISPEADGYEICRRLKRNEETQDIPVIFISALDHAIDKVKAFKVGGVDYITKPFQADEVLARVHNHIQQHQIKKQMEIQYEALQKEIVRRKHAERELEQINKQLELLVTYDSLTGLMNRKHFNTSFELEWRRMVREKESMALLICDIDGFEEYNRTYGTVAGDSIIQKMAKIIKRMAKRPGDIVARWGEDEFILLLPRTDEQGAATLAKQIQGAEIDLSSLDPVEEGNKTVSISIGIAGTVPSIGIKKETLLSDATEALAMAKNTRSSCVRFSDIISS